MGKEPTDETHRVSYRPQRFAVIVVKPQRRIVGFTPKTERCGVPAEVARAALLVDEDYRQPATASRQTGWACQYWRVQFGTPQRYIEGYLRVAVDGTLKHRRGVP